MLTASQTTFFRAKKGAARPTRQNFRQEPWFLSVEDKGGNAILAHFFCGSNLRGHATGAFERARHSRTVLDVLSNLRDERDQSRGRIPARVLRKEPIHVGK